MCPKPFDGKWFDLWVDLHYGLLSSDQAPQTGGGLGSLSRVMEELTIWELPATEARKAEGASLAKLLMPKPPAKIGREAWVQALSSN